MKDPFGQIDLFTPEAAEEMVQQLREQHGAENVIEERRDAHFIVLRITVAGWAPSTVHLPLTTGFPRAKEQP